MSDGRARDWAKTAQRNIDVTFTRVGTYFLTAPCGFAVSFPEGTDEQYVRRVASVHRRECCRRARLHISAPSGEYRREDAS